MLTNTYSSTEYKNFKQQSIYDIVYHAYCQHNDIILTKDAVLSQFFTMLEECETNHVFGSVKSKETIVVEVPRQMSKEELVELPLQFSTKLNLSAINENLSLKNALLKQMLANCSVPTQIFAMCGFSKRYDYCALTLCKVPNITFNFPAEEVAALISIMHDVANCSQIIGDNWQANKSLKTLQSYITLLNKVYDAQFKGIKDENFFHNLIQKNNGSGGPTTGFINNMMTSPSESFVKVSRICLGKKYPDLVYSAKLCILKKGNDLIFDVACHCPETDTTVA